ncbi:hypothetical protein, partial [Bacillus badius]|nr:hypothetical protein [Bacillus badius]
MRSKLCLFVGIALIFLSGCGSESTSKKFDSAINEVISLENKRLEREKLFREKDVLKREDTGIIVYSDGKYIELIYTIDSTQQIESMFEYNEK